MKFLCLAYGDEEGWNSLSKDEQQEVLAQDDIVTLFGTEDQVRQARQMLLG